MRNITFFSCLLLLIGGCTPTKLARTSNSINQDKIVLAFGSCSNQDKAQNLWDDLITERPNYWIWLGDNIYGDSEDMTVLKAKYDQQKKHPLYQQFIKNTQVIGTWDDHDYGANDAGKEFAKKAESQQLLLDFLDVPNNAPVRTRQGVYDSYTIDNDIATVKIILLDTRYFRDTLTKVNGKNTLNWKGKILGETQWEWLENEFKNSEAAIHIIGSSIQVIPMEHRFEKWNNFPLERQRLFNLITKYQVNRPIFISGDRHIGEISKIDWVNQPIYDVTSSSLTHGWSNRRLEANRHRIGELVYNENYGLIEISKKDSLQIDISIRSDNREVETAISLN